MTLSLFAPVPVAPADRPGRTQRRLTELVRDLADRPDVWAHLARFDAGECWWTRLDSPPGTDVWLLTWLRSQSTDLHDHGDAFAAFAVARGELEELRPAGPRLTSTPVRRGDVRRVAPGAVHDVRNVLQTPAVSIHAYAPALTSMTFYAWRRGRLAPLRAVATAEPEVVE